MKPQKYAACRSVKENQTISTITNDRDEQRHLGNNSIPHPGIYDGDRLTQVKTYTDHGNGYGQRSGGTTHYSKVLATHTRLPRFSLFGELISPLCFGSYLLVESARTLTWIHRRRRVKTVSRRPHCNDTIRISICHRWTVNRRATFECIIRVIVHMPDKGHYAST